jgi:hypothetical protein
MMRIAYAVGPTTRGLDRVKESLLRLRGAGFR